MLGHPEIPSPLDFFGRLLWLDGRALMDTIEPYRREFLMRALYTFRPDGTPLYNQVISGRAKKNWKSTDLILSAFYRMLCWASYQGNDAYILANDIGQAGDDLSLAKKLVAVNPEIAAEVIVMDKEIRRRDGRGKMEILPSRDAVGQHGKTALFLGFDEIHGYRNWDLFEALAPDPTRPDTLTWITSYDTIFNSPGVPLFDLKKAALEGSDPRMLFQWYSGGDICTDPAFADLPAEQRANPSMSSWPEGEKYLEQQRRRLPSHKFRRLHLNLPGAPNGAFFDGDSIMKAIVTGLKRIPPDPTRKYFAWCDMSGGSSDDSVLAIAHFEGGRHVLDLVESQTGGTPFNPRDAVRKFAQLLRQYRTDSVTGDRYAGQTFQLDFGDCGIRYIPTDHSASDCYEAVEPMFNAGEIELLDQAKLQEQLLTLVVRGAKVTHQPGDHDDYAAAACGALAMMPERIRQRREPRPVIVESMSGYDPHRGKYVGGHREALIGGRWVQ
jgi:hypothetical protein